jgi:hypothetical protein
MLIEFRLQTKHIIPHFVQFEPAPQIVLVDDLERLIDARKGFFRPQQRVGYGRFLFRLRQLHDELVVDIL